MRISLAVRTLGLAALLACFSPGIVMAQEAPQRPPSKSLILHPVSPNSTTDPSSIEIGSLSDFAARLLHHAPEAGCAAGKCTILVADFVFSDGSTFPDGIWWADELSNLFAAGESNRQAVDRSLVTYFMRKLEIPAKIANQEASARLLGKKCGATVVLVGQAKMVRSDVVELSARFLDVNDEHRIGPSSEVDLLIRDSRELVPLNGVAPRVQRSSPFPEFVNGERVYNPGTPGLTIASCYYMPNPPYTADAREAKFSGIVIAEAAVGSDGMLRAIRIVQGAPFELNNEVEKTLSTWKCRPSQLDGKPVATVVPFEVNFRLYSGN